MPPKSKLKTLTEQNTKDESTTENLDSENQFERELSWCVNQLELGLCNQKPDSRQMVETVKVLKILKSDKAPLVKKRQAMRNTFGDYRQKIREEEKKNASKMKKLKVTPVSSSQNKSVFYKKSLKLANDDYVALMGSINVNSDSSETVIKQEALSGFKFGFSVPTVCEAETTVKEEGKETDFHEVSDSTKDKILVSNTTDFVMPKSDNSFRFNFGQPP